MNNVTSIPFSCIDVKDRIREKYENIEELAESISTYGLLQPLVVEEPPSPDSQVYGLRCGGRRWTAMKLLIERKTVTSRFNYEDYIPVRTFGTLNPEERLLIELEENFQRESMTWQEAAQGLARFHRMKVRSARAIGEKWIQEATSKLFGIHQCDVSNALKIDEYLQAGNEQVKAAENSFNAMQVIFRIELDIAQKEQLMRMQRKAGEAKSAPVVAAPTATAALLAGRTKSSTENSVLTALLADEPKKPTVDKATILSWYTHGNAIRVINDMIQKKQTVNHILTDPPYAIDMANLTGASIARIADTHKVKPNLELLRQFITSSFDVVNEDGFLVMWYDLDHHEKIIDWAQEVGWRPQVWPFMWCKTTPCSNSQAQYNITKTTETCMIMRRSEKSVLVNKRANNFEVGPNPRYSTHPFVKPEYIWNCLLKLIARPGQTIWDPFAGEGSALAAIHKYGCVPMGTEIDEKHIASGLSYINNEINGGDILNATIEPPF